MASVEEDERRGRAHLMNTVRRSRITSHALLLFIGMALGFYGASILGPYHHLSSHGDAAADVEVLSRWRDMEAKEKEATKPCPACPKCPNPVVVPASNIDNGGGGGGGGAGPSKEELKRKMGLETFGFVDGKQAFTELLDFMPPNIKDSVFDQAMLLVTNDAKMPFTAGHTPNTPLAFDNLRQCQEVDVISMARGRCYLAVNTQLHHTSYHVQRYEEDSSNGKPWALVPRIKLEGSTPPISVNRAKHEKFLKTLYNNLEDLEKKAKSFFESVADENNRVMIMALNEGDTDMLVNFICSAKQAQISLDNLVVIGADQSVVDVAASLGLHSFSHPAFGELPSEHAKHYGDAGFLAIMWLKIVSVWIAIRQGYDVLFQDADLVWFKPPWEVFDDPEIDAYFMDDGSRSERFSPLYANSGFYFLRSNPRIVHFMQTVLFTYGEVVQYASHQTVFIQALQEHISRNGVRVKLLSNMDFPGGQVFHHRKDYMAQISARTAVPYIFHMCWTQHKIEKLQNLIAADLWFLTGACGNGSEATMKTQREGKLSLSTCCVDPMIGKTKAS